MIDNLKSGASEDAFLNLLKLLTDNIETETEETSEKRHCYFDDNVFGENLLRGVLPDTLPTPGVTQEVLEDRDHIMDRFSTKDLQEAKPEFFEDLEQYLESFASSIIDHFKNMDMATRRKNMLKYKMVMNIIKKERSMAEQALKKLNQFPDEIEAHKANIARLQAMIAAEEMIIKDKEKTYKDASPSHITELSSIKKALGIMDKQYDKVFNEMLKIENDKCCTECKTQFTEKKPQQEQTFAHRGDLKMTNEELDRKFAKFISGIFGC